MMKSHKILILLCLLFTSVSFAQAGHCADIYETVYKKADLPTGGQFVPNSKDKSEVYYFTNQSWMQLDKSNSKKVSGLYHSIDSGQTWFLLCDYFQFRQLFIHPSTGRLFAVIEYHPLIEVDGYLVPAIADKAIESIDGKHWKDIMGKQKDASMILSIFQDPDHPNRVCLAANMFNNVILQSKDADYSDWEVIPSFVWDTKHPLARVN